MLDISRHGTPPITSHRLFIYSIPNTDKQALFSHSIILRSPFAHQKRAKHKNQPRPHLPRMPQNNLSRLHPATTQSCAAYFPETAISNTYTNRLQPASIPFCAASFPETSTCKHPLIKDNFSSGHSQHPMLLQRYLLHILFNLQKMNILQKIYAIKFETYSQKYNQY
ncbi:hypothetical protein [Candidatus Magnetaquicoccus inordinatus]|uniref:hypothetical protein n=1 Tax=Candidatus Magnetaquicoccus inordinatus TaxID=2496818 RepID=UPI00102B3A46|nr:hypothetical protein [Candidatus Magnetaquicoccus inordinatus]